MPESAARRRVEVIGVASGKGGVGKTTVSSNLALSLHAAGHRVMLLDADLGLANVQLALGVRAEFNLSHVMRGEKSLQDIIVQVRPGLQLVPGASGVQEMAALRGTEIAGIIQAFSGLPDDCDYLIVDVAAGISPSVLSFMAACTRRVVVLRDEPSSIADAYGIIKVMVQDHGLDQIHLVTNMVNSERHGAQLFTRIHDVCQRFLGSSVGYLGCIEQEEMVNQAIRQYKPVVEVAPGCAAARDFRRLARAVMALPPDQGPGGGLQFFFERLIAGSTEGAQS